MEGKGSRLCFAAAAIRPWLGGQERCIMEDLLEVQPGRCSLIELQKVEMWAKEPGESC